MLLYLNHSQGIIAELKSVFQFEKSHTFHHFKKLRRQEKDDSMRSAGTSSQNHI